MPSITFEQSGAFIEQFEMSPTADGPLAGLTFAAKDLIDIADHRTGCGNPTWLETHQPAVVSAVCVEQLLAAGATCLGKTVTDEIAFSLLGENHFYGTPLNPAAPDRVPGGSSSGSASAVACGLVDFALGTDTGGSVRVPASNCGIWGLRPTHGIISTAGVMPLAPTLDTIGILARDIDVLRRVAAVLLPLESNVAMRPIAGVIHIVEEAFALADSDIQEALSELIRNLAHEVSSRVQITSLVEICNDDRAADMLTWLTLYRVLQGTEMQSCLGAWIADAKPSFGPAPSAGLEFVKKLDRTRIGESVQLREHLCNRLNAALASGDILCIPSAPTIAPLKGSKAYDRNSDYYRRTLSLTSIAGVGRLPQVSMPIASASSAPIGLSLLAARWHDLPLLDVATMIANQLPRRR